MGMVRSNADKVNLAGKDNKRLKSGAQRSFRKPTTLQAPILTHRAIEADKEAAGNVA